MRPILFILFAACMPGIVCADQNDTRLDELFEIMLETENAAVANSAEQRIWTIWLEVDDSAAQETLANGMAAMESDHEAALAIFTALTEQAPGFAEGWNKRATVYYLLGEYAASERDIERTLSLEPRHFGALSGLGLVSIAQNKFVQARSAFEAVLAIHPHSEGTSRLLEMVDVYVKRQSI